jgi:hypothetical protein
VYEVASFLSLVSEQEYQEMKKSGSAGLAIPILADLLSLSTDYSDFLKKMKSFISEVRSSWSTSSKLDFKSIRTSPISYEKWGACMEQCLQAPGVVLISTLDNDQFGSVKVKYIAGPDDPNTAKINIRINSANHIKDTIIQLKKSGTEIVSFRRTYSAHISETIVTASIRRSYSASIKSVYAKVPQNKITSIDYYYEKKVTTEAIGAPITTCNHDNTLELVKCNQENSAWNGWGRSCDNKWTFSYYKVSITAPTGYVFENDILSGNIIYEGESATWNYGNCPTKQYNVLVSNPTYKQIRVAVGSKSMRIYLKLVATKNDWVKAKTYPFQSDSGIAEFAIDNDKLNHYSINIMLADGKVITVNEHSHGVSKRSENDKTIFTVPI